MAQIKTIQSRLGQRDIDPSMVIHFPRGLIGFERLHEFILLEIREETPFLVLQSIADPGLGLLVADPFSFLPEYKVEVNTTDQKLLQVESADQLAVLVTASIPPGKPEETTLNLTGPIVINHAAKIGLQVPQTDKKADSNARLLLKTLQVE